MEAGLVTAQSSRIFSQAVTASSEAKERTTPVGVGWVEIALEKAMLQTLWTGRESQISPRRSPSLMLPAQAIN